MRPSLPPSAPALAAVLALAASAADAAPAETACVAPGVWLDVAASKPIAVDALADRLATLRVVLLGENHDDADHHRWQLHTMAAILGRNPDLVLGFEAFPRRAQAVLDRWTVGALDQAGLLGESGWDTVWGGDPDLYMPLFHFARLNRLPMLALNVDRGLIQRIGEGGRGAVPADALEGVGEPAPPSPAYRERLREAFAAHAARRDDGAAFGRFVEAQATWDRAMAEAIAAAVRPGRVVVGVIGRGHLEFGHGVPHQLAALGVTDVAVLLPWEAERPCSELRSADGAAAAAVFGLAPWVEGARPGGPRLGVRIRSGDGGLHVDEVTADSVAAAAGLKTGDVIATAAGVRLGVPADLIAIVRRQAPGTWLPLKVRRAGASLELVGRFPPAP